MGFRVLDLNSLNSLKVCYMGFRAWGLGSKLLKGG